MYFERNKSFYYFEIRIFRGKAAKKNLKIQEQKSILGFQLLPNNSKTNFKKLKFQKIKYYIQDIPRAVFIKILFFQKVINF